MKVVQALQAGLEDHLQLLSSNDAAVLLEKLPHRAGDYDLVLALFSWRFGAGEGQDGFVCEMEVLVELCRGGLTYAH